MAVVIVVYDDEAVRDSLKFVLELEGLEVVLYRDAGEVLNGPNLADNACLLISCHMPAMTGLELAQVLRVRCVRLPAILMTEKVSSELCRLARQIGFQAVLEKPLEDGLLMEAIRDALARCA